MLCNYCKKENVIEGVLEGVSFVPLREHKKTFSTGIYGINAFVCLSCGQLSHFSLDLDAFQKILKKVRDKEG